jgi:hypothetical protein
MIPNPMTFAESSYPFAQVSACTPGKGPSLLKSFGHNLYPREVSIKETKKVVR